MKYERFVDELRMKVAESNSEKRVENEIRQRLKPKLMHAASRGETYREFSYKYDTISPTAAFVKNHWEEVKAYFEKQGLTCQEVSPDTFVISWD